MDARMYLDCCQGAQCWEVFYLGHKMNCLTGAIHYNARVLWEVVKELWLLGCSGWLLGYSVWLVWCSGTLNLYFKSVLGDC